MDDKQERNANDARLAATGLPNPTGGFAAGLLARLSAARWTLVAAVVAIALLGWAGGVPLWLVLAAAAAVAVVAAFAPGGPVPVAESVPARPAGGVPVERLSALRLAEAVGDPLVLLDGGGLVVHANRAARDAFGLSPGIDLLVRFRAPEMQALLRNLLSGNAGALDYAERLPLERMHRVTATPVGGGTGLHVLLFKDQSEARRIDRMRADFIANASHELRTPLASIAGFVETLKGPAKNDAAARERFLGIMQDQTSRMARLIDDLLSLSRLEMKRMIRPGEKADLVRVVRSVADALGHIAADSGVAIALDLPEAPLEVPGSSDELTQVFQNLLENAVKYGRSGGRVELSLRRDNASGRPEVAVSVRDYGPGIAAEHLPRVTERFYRGDVESTTSQKGTGLGLSIVKHILTRHDGRLAIESEPGQGATFTVYLPAG